MPVPIPAAVEELSDAAVAKATQARRVPRYLFASALAGVYVGVAVVLLLSVSAPLLAAESPATRLAQGAVFGVALTLVVFAGAELFTGNVMVMLQGLVRGRVGLGPLAAVLGLSLVGNAVGSLAFAGLVHGGGTLGAGPGASALAAIVDGKAAVAGPQLFWRAVLCNMLVCLGLWMATRTRSDAAKLVVLWWVLLAFVASGFEHSVANMTLFGLGVFSGAASWGDLAFNLAWTIPGNAVGGGLIVGLGYAWIAHERRVATAPAAPNGAHPNGEAVQIPAATGR